jgi:tetratricopeptide (TPR) repeat protein
VQGGQRFRVKIPPGASTLEVRDRQKRGEPAWSLALAEPSWPLWERTAFRLNKRNQGEKARDLIKARLPSLPRAEQGRAYSFLAKLALWNADAEAAEMLERARATHHAVGAVLGEADAVAGLVWIQLQRRDFAGARRSLAEFRVPAGAPAEATYYRSYYQGTLAENMGDARSAIAELTAALGQAERVDLAREGWDAEQMLARQYQALGRSREAAARFDHLRRTRPRALSACEWAEMLTNQAWTLLQAGEAGEDRRDPLPLLEEARRTFAGGGCSRPGERRLNFLLDLTLARLQDDQLPLARASLSATRQLRRFATPLQRLWLLELSARLDLAAHRPADALRRYEQLAKEAAVLSSPESQWGAAYGRARCFREMGRLDDALDAFAEAERMLDAQSLQIPLQEGRNSFLAQRKGATARHLELLLAQGNTTEALAVARRSRSRVLGQLVHGDRLAHLKAAEQQGWDQALAEYAGLRAALDQNAGSDWQLPADQLSGVRAAREAQREQVEAVLDRAFAVLGESRLRATALPPLRDGEVLLAYYPLPKGWLGFAAVAGQPVVVHRFDLPESVQSDLPALAARLLAPFRAQLLQARRVRVLPYGILRMVDFHALPFEGRVLIAVRPVVYGLDLDTPSGKQPSGRRALVVANPLEDLPAADREARDVERALHDQRPRWSAQVLRGPDASVHAVLRALPSVDLLHYAGHGIFSGFGGWESELPLAGSTRLTLSDLLTLRTPSWVVLSGCETGRSSQEAPAEELSLAHAFLLGGSRAVIAATRPVGDSAARGFFAPFYRRWSAEPDLAALLRDAQLAWRRRDPHADWASFRLFEP